MDAPFDWSPPRPPERSRHRFRKPIYVTEYRVRLTEGDAKSMFSVREWLALSVAFAVSMGTAVFVGASR